MGALLDAVVAGLRNLPSVMLDRLPRLADFAMWVTAAEPALGWPPGSFLSAYSGNRQSANDLALESSLVSAPLRAFANDVGSWEGSSTELLEKLSSAVGENVTRKRGWPGGPKALTNALRRLAPNLRAVGVDVAFPDRRQPNTGRRLVVIRTLGNPRSPQSPTFIPGEEPLFPNALEHQDIAPGVNVGERGERTAPAFSSEPGYPPEWDEV